MTNFKIVKEPMLYDFIIFDTGEKLNCYKLIATINQMLETQEDDKYGNYSYREYEIEDIESIKYLVKNGYVKKYLGERQAILYCAKDIEALKELIELIEFTLNKVKDNKYSYIMKEDLIHFLMENYNPHWSFNDLLEKIKEIKTYTI